MGIFLLGFALAGISLTAPIVIGYLLAGIPLFALTRKVKVYPAFLEGAKEGFDVAVAEARAEVLKTQEQLNERAARGDFSLWSV